METKTAIIKLISDKDILTPYKHLPPETLAICHFDMLELMQADIVIYTDFNENQKVLKNKFGHVGSIGV